MNAKLVLAFFVLSLISLLIPFFVWFNSNLAKTRGRHTWKHSRWIKRSFAICVPASLIFILIGILVSGAL